MNLRRQRLTATSWCLLGTAMVLGVLVGDAYNQVSRHIDAALILPALAGFAAGGVIALLGRAVLHAGPAVVLRAAALAGALAFASSFYFDYRDFRNDLAHIGGGAPLPAAQIDALESRLIGSPGFFSYLSARANDSLAPAGHAAGSAPVRGDAEWLLWAAEIALAGGAGAVAARASIGSERRADAPA